MIDEEYIDEIHDAASADINIFPKFLFAPVFNDFGDKYYQIGVSVDPLVIKARSIKRKYTDYFKYIDALDSYNEYMNLLYEKYGGSGIIKSIMKAKEKAEISGNLDEIEMYENAIEDVIPPKPELKKKRKNKDFLALKVIPSKRLDNEVDSEAILDNAKSMYALNPNADTIDEMDIFKEPPKHMKKSLKRMADKIAAQARRDNIFFKESNSGADFIVEYMNNASKGYYDEKGKYKESSLKDYVKDEYKREHMPKELYEDELLSSQYVISSIGGSTERYVKKSKVDQIEIAKALYSIGIDVTGTMAKGMNKESVKIFRRAIGADRDAPMTKKELKKIKKQQKKESEMLEKRKDNDRLLSNVLLKNKIGFSRNGSSLNFRLKDLQDNDD